MALVAGVRVTVACWVETPVGLTKTTCTVLTPETSSVAEKPTVTLAALALVLTAAGETVKPVRTGGMLSVDDVTVRVVGKPFPFIPLVSRVREFPAASVRNRPLTVQLPGSAPRGSVIVTEEVVVVDGAKLDDACWLEPPDGLSSETWIPVTPERSSVAVKFNCTVAGAAVVFTEPGLIEKAVRLGGFVSCGEPTCSVVGKPAAAIALVSMMRVLPAASAKKMLLTVHVPAVLNR